MAVIGVGVDVVPVERVEQLLDRHGARALRRLFTTKELARAETFAHRGLHLAGRLAAKEAAYKALSAEGADTGISWRHLEIERLDDGRPQLVLHGPARQRFDALGATRAHLSLSHDGGIAAAIVILER
jgi:holo-[acyl-carrier protein] synthase